MKHQIKDELSGVLVFVAVIWAVYFADFVIPGDLTDWGLIPRTLWGLIGIVTSPFLHANFGHLLGNTIPLLVLLMLLAGSRTRTWESVIEIALLGGGLLWLLGRNGSSDSGLITHVGASGLIYGLIAFLLVAGFKERRFLPLVVALIVGFMYGGTLLSGVLPSVGSQVSWDGHLYGAIAGGIVALVTVSSEAEKSADESPFPPS